MASITARETAVSIGGVGLRAAESNGALFAAIFQTSAESEKIMVPEKDLVPEKDRLVPEKDRHSRPQRTNFLVPSMFLLR